MADSAAFIHAAAMGVTGDAVDTDVEPRGVTCGDVMADVCGGVDADDVSDSTRASCVLVAERSSERWRAT